MSTDVVRLTSCSNAVAGDCSHSNTLIVRKRFANNTVHLTRQCQTRGAQVGAWLKQDIYAPADMPEWDEGLRRRWLDRDQLVLL